MEEFKDHFYLGIIHKTVGLNGELSIKFDVDDLSRYKTLQHFFVAVNGQLVPYFIKKIQVRSNDQAVIHVEGIDNITAAEKIVGSSVYLPLNALPKLEGNKFYFHEVIGFTVIDKEHGEIGTIEKVLDFPQQDILLVKKGYATEILIPVRDEIIKKVNRALKNIEIEAPKGLIDIYIHPTANNEEE